MRKFTRRIVLSTVAAASIAAVSAIVPGPVAAQDYPSKPITVIVPFGAGGGFDQMVRALQPVLEEELGVALAIKNSPGAGGRRGSIELFRSEPDGYTIGLSYFVPFLTDKHVLGKELPVKLEDYAVIYRTTHDSHFMYTSADSPNKTLEDFGKMDQVKFSTTGIGSSAWIGAHVMAQKLGFEPVFIGGYKTLSEAALGVARGDADASFGGKPHFGGMIDDVRPLVYLGGERDEHFPDVPTATELGYPDTALLGGIHIFSAPPGTPEDQLEVLRVAFRNAVKDPRFVEWAKGNSTRITPGEPNEVFEQAKAIGELFESLNIKVDQ